MTTQNLLDTVKADFCLLVYLFIFDFLGPYPWHMEVPQARGPIGGTAAGLHHSHIKAR